MGHRGLPSEAPENSLTSFRRAADAGVDAIELDVQLTRDHQLAVVHDWSTERVAASTLIVEETSWKRLSDLRLVDADGKPTRERIPQLAQVFEAVPASLPINVELKQQTADPDALLDAVCPLLNDRSRCWVSSFDWDLLKRLHYRQPDLPLAPLTSRRRLRFDSTARTLHAVALHCSTRALSDAMLRRARTAARPVLVYTVDGPEQAQALFDRGVAGVFTNQARRLLQTLR